MGKAFRLSRRGIVLLTLFAYFGWNGFARADEEIDAAIKITFVEGKVALLAGSVDKEMPLKMGDMLRVNHIIRTGRDGKIELTFPDACILRLGPESKLRILSINGNPKVEHGGVRAFLVFGDLWAYTAASKRESRFGIGLQGCITETFDGVYRIKAFPDQTVEVKTYRGVVDVTSPVEIADSSQRESTDAKEKPAASETASTEIGNWSFALPAFNLFIFRPQLKPGKPFRFAAKGDQTPWVKWNIQRDGSSTK
jgi:hypothetical protein